MAKDFDDFLERQQSKPAQVETGDILSEWKKSIDDLYEDIYGFLSAYISEKKVTTSLSDIPIHEERLGNYSLKQLLIKVGGEEVVLRPIARLVIGSMGRVDVIGSRGRTRLVRLFASATARNMIQVNVRVAGRAVPEPRLSPKAPDEPVVWRLVASPPNLKFLELNRDSFLTALVDVSSG